MLIQPQEEHEGEGSSVHLNACKQPTTRVQTLNGSGSWIKTFSNSESVRGVKEQPEGDRSKR